MMNKTNTCYFSEWNNHSLFENIPSIKEIEVGNGSSISHQEKSDENTSLYLPDDALIVQNIYQ